MKRFSPILIGLIHTAISLVVLIATVFIDFFTIFSFEYVWGFVFIPSVLVPIGIIFHRILKRNSTWWAVGLGCVISIATSFTHIAFIILSSGGI